MTRPIVDRRYVHFVELFNEREFYEAHDVLEDLWMETEGGERLFYQGLIQAAVSLHHYMRGNYIGARSLERSADAKLTRFPSVFMGGHAHQLIYDLHDYYDRRIRNKGEEIPYRPDDPIPEFTLNRDEIDIPPEPEVSPAE